MVATELLRRWSLGDGRAAFGGEVWDVRPVAHDLPRRVMLLEPHTFMNRSGEAVKGLVTFYKAELSDVLVVLDDMALPLGMLRARAEGSAGGHNGLKDIIALLGSEQVPRLRIGIGAAPPQMDPADYVLATFADDEVETVNLGVGRAADAVEDWIRRDMRYVMDKYNRKADA